MSSKICITLTVIALILMVATIAFQAMEMQSYSLFKSTYEKYIGSSAASDAKAPETAGKTDTATDNDASEKTDTAVNSSKSPAGSGDTKTESE